MKLIEQLEDLIDEEISDIKKYAKMATKLKAEHPGLAQVLYTISTQEEAHKNMLHNEVVKIIEHHRSTHGAPPAEMMAVYDYVHKKHIEKAAEAKRYQEMYKTT
jgi:hypothetical protein